jgi:phosphonate transport system ATP-binding protein
MPTITCSELSLRYPGGTQALAGIDLKIEPGVFTVLLGSSGAGKSSLLRCINGMVQPTSGSVTVDGTPVRRDRHLRAIRRRIGMVFQMHQLIGRQSALNNVLTGRLGHYHPLRTLLPMPAAEARFALQCLARVGMLDKAWQRCDRLSGGQRQRVAVARALAQQPQILLADEPVASLDPASAESVLELMRTICAQDALTAVVSLHQVDFARRFADRIIGVSGGRVVHDGSPASLDDDVLARIYGGASSHSPANRDPTPIQTPADDPDRAPEYQEILT